MLTAENSLIFVCHFFPFLMLILGVLTLLFRLSYGMLVKI